MYRIRWRISISEFVFDANRGEISLVLTPISLGRQSKGEMGIRTREIKLKQLFDVLCNGEAARNPLLSIKLS
jgi:hypothetical protein